MTFAMSAAVTSANVSVAEGKSTAPTNEATRPASIGASKPGQYEVWGFFLFCGIPVTAAGASAC